MESWAGLGFAESSLPSPSKPPPHPSRQEQLLPGLLFSPLIPIYPEAAGQQEASVTSLCHAMQLSCDCTAAGTHADIWLREQ